MRFRIHFFMLAGLLSISLYAAAQLNEVHNEWKNYFDHFKVKGSCVVYSLKQDKYFFYERAQFTVGHIPASTFKIFNSLVALQTKVIPDENYVIKWDGVKRANEEWNKDTDMKNAFKNSTVWFYQELARRIGEKRMKKYIDKNKYGNMDISGGIDQFWLTGSLRISPKQQIDLLEKLYKNKLHFKNRYQEIIKQIMLQEDTPGYKLRGKTGRGMEMSNNIGWYVGYVERGEDVFFFATCINDEAIDNPDFSKSRIIITRRILRDLKIIPEAE